MAVAEVAIGILSTIGTFLMWTWWLFVLIIMWSMKKSYEKWPIDVVIIEKRGENLIKTNDRMGRVFEKGTGITFYKLKKIGDTIPVYNFDWVLHNADKPLNVFEKIVTFLRPTTGTAFLFRYGSKQYKPINVGQNSNIDSKLELQEIKDKHGESLFIWNYGQFDPRWVLGVLDFEVVDWDNMNFMVQEHRSTALRRAKAGDWWKQFGISAMILGVTALVALLILKFSADAGASLRAGGGLTQAPKQGGSIIGGAISGAIDSPAPGT